MSISPQPSDRHEDVAALPLRVGDKGDYREDDDELYGSLPSSDVPPDPSPEERIPRPKRSAASMELDPVAHDAVTQGVPIPPADLPPDQRRAYLGGEFCGQRGGGSRSMNPYRDLGCAEAWLNGFDRVRRELAAGL